MRALITGVTGFVGSHLAEHLLAAGDEVLGATLRGAWPADAPRQLAGRVPLVAWDLARPDAPAAAQAQIARFAPDCLYHLAALSVPERCGDAEPTPEALALNVGGTERVLALAAHLPHRPRVLLVSSSHVYAPVYEGTPPVAEHWPLAPLRAYGRTKLAAEEAVRRAASAGLEAAIARSFQHAGPRQRPPMMLAQWAAQVAGGGPVVVQNVRTRIDLCDVRDAVRAYRLLVLHGRRGEAYNVGSAVPRWTGDVLDVLLRLTGPREVVVHSRHDRYDPVADCSRLRRLTGWRPEIPLEQTVADTLAWWQAQARAEGARPGPIGDRTVQEPAP
jgi:GDP-4-dehydro-6-deoxy-D-mannose reductase